MLVPSIEHQVAAVPSWIKGKVNIRPSTCIGKHRYRMLGRRRESIQYAVAAAAAQPMLLTSIFVREAFVHNFILLSESSQEQEKEQGLRQEEEELVMQCLTLAKEKCVNTGIMMM